MIHSSILTGKTEVETSWFSNLPESLNKNGATRRKIFKNQRIISIKIVGERESRGY